MNTYIVVREHAGHRIYYGGMQHSRDHAHTTRWLDTAPYAGAFVTRGDAAIIAKKHGAVVVEARVTSAVIP
jgi:hypothetical protein